MKYLILTNYQYTLNIHDWCRSIFVSYNFLQSIKHNEKQRVQCVRNNEYIELHLYIILEHAGISIVPRHIYLPRKIYIFDCLIDMKNLHLQLSHEKALPFLMHELFSIYHYTKYIWLLLAVSLVKDPIIIVSSFTFLELLLLAPYLKLHYLKVLLDNLVPRQIEI